METSYQQTPLQQHTLLQRLRSETAPAHKAVESLPLSQKIIGPALQAAEYAHYLRLMLAVNQCIEETIFPRLQEFLGDLPQRRKLALLKADLDYLNEPASQETIPPFYIPDIKPSASFAWGILYVTEGSTLGGRYLLKNIEEKLGFTPGCGASYFSGYGDQTGSRWKTFLSQMTHYADQFGEESTIIQGANAGFRSIHAHLNSSSSLFNQL